MLTAKGLWPIENIRLGRRIRTSPDEQVDRENSEINPANFRVIRLHFVKDGQEYHLSFLRPAKAFEGLGAGDFIALSVLELRIAGPARVVGIDPCPPIEEGLGRVVTGSFHSQSGEVLLLKLQGMEAPIEITSNHPIYSEDRLSFTSVKRLAVGERVRALDGVAIVEALSRKYGSYEVFNLEIDKAHRYYVSEKLVLVHNAGDCGISPAESAWEDDGGPPVQEPEPNAAAAENPATPSWSATKSLSAEENAAAHAAKHAGEFPELAQGEYAQAAQKFVQNPPQGVLTKVRPNGDTLLYDPATNTFAVRAANGAPRTMFRPTDGINYWNRQ